MTSYSNQTGMQNTTVVTSMPMQAAPMIVPARMNFSAIRGLGMLFLYQVNFLSCQTT